MNANASIAKETKTRSKRRMKSTVSGTDDQGGHDVSQLSSSSEAKFNTYPITTPPRHIIYTTAQLHENVAYHNKPDQWTCQRIPSWQDKTPSSSKCMATKIRITTITVRLCITFLSCMLAIAKSNLTSPVRIASKIFNSNCNRWTLRTSGRNEQDH